MDPPPQLVRRALLTPIAWVGSALLLPVALILAPIAFLLDLVDRRAWRFTRLLVLGAAFCGLEFVALSAAFGIWTGVGWRADEQRTVAAYQSLLAWWLGSITSAMRRCLNYRFDVRFPDTGPAPLIILSRHAGPGDALFLMSELANTQGRHIRAIGKGKLLWDPFFEQVAARAGYLFLQPGDPDPLATIRRHAAMRARGAFITFPEGGNYTTSRHHRSVSEFRDAGKHAEADAAAGLRHLLLPRTGGVHAALLGAPDAVIVFVGHSGYDDLESLSGLWRAIPERRAIRLEARAVPRPPGWEDRQVVSDWLMSCWSDMDRWIQKHTDTAVDR